MKTKRGRPKGRSNDKRSFGPLGDLIRKHRLERSLGLLDVAKACDCSVQFISNIEHGRAPLPWEKIPSLASYLKITQDSLQAANLSVRADFKTFMKSGKKSKPIPGAVTAIATAARDAELCMMLERYQLANDATRKKFIKLADKMLQ